jgi:hypothetical protein
VSDRRRLNRDHQFAKFRQSQPPRRLSPQHAAFASDDKHEPRLRRAGTPQKSQQLSMRFSLSMAVQIEARVNSIVPARYTLLFSPAERRQWRR